MALGEARSILNVGAGTGSYEPADRSVVAVEPSAVMLAQRARDAAPATRARAEALPFADRRFDAVMAVLTLHHWADKAAGLRECARVARHRVVLLTWDPDLNAFWLFRTRSGTVGSGEGCRRKCSHGPRATGSRSVRAAGMNSIESDG